MSLVSQYYKISINTQKSFNIYQDNMINYCQHQNLKLFEQNNY